MNFYHIAPLPGAEDYARAVAYRHAARDGLQRLLQEPTDAAHPRLSSAELEAEHTEAVRRFYAWRHVLRRVTAGVLGIGRARVVAPWTYAKRQLGFKLMILAGLHSVLRRRPAAAAQRALPLPARGDLRRGRAAPLPRRERAAARAAALPAELLRDGSMESLPILRRHVLTAPAPAGRAA